jgi:hypothetical protein
MEHRSLLMTTENAKGSSADRQFRHTPVGLAVRHLTEGRVNFAGIEHNAN